MPPPEPSLHMMRALANTRREICLNRCPRGPSRCEQWTASGERLALDPAARCPADAWHEFRRDMSALTQPRRTNPAQLVKFLPLPAGDSLPPGPGTFLKKMFSRLGITAVGGCACNKRAAEMDRQGPDWCATHIDTIIEWLAEEAARRNLCFSNIAARILIRVAIARARLAEKRSKGD